MRPVPKARIKLGGGANVKFTKNGTSLTRSGYCPTSITKSDRGQNNEPTGLFGELFDSDIFIGFKKQDAHDKRGRLRRAFDGTIILLLHFAGVVVDLIYLFFHIFIFGVLALIIGGIMYVLFTILSLLF